MRLRGGDKIPRTFLLVLYGNLPYINLTDTAISITKGDPMPVKKAPAAKKDRLKMARLEARVSREQKELFQRAAELTGRSLTDFVVSNLQEVAIRTIQEHDLITLSQDDQAVFVRALLSPPAPNRPLRRAAQAYRKKTGG